MEIIPTGHDYRFVGRVGQFCPVKPGCGGGELYRMNAGKYYAAAGSTGYRWVETDTIRGVNEDAVDLSFYQKLVDDAVETISQYGDFEWFASDDPYMGPEPVANFMNAPEEDELPWDIHDDGKNVTN